MYLCLKKTAWGEISCHALPGKGIKARPVFILDVGMLKGVEKKMISFVVIVLLSVGLLCHDGSDEFLDFGFGLVRRCLEQLFGVPPLQIRGQQADRTEMKPAIGQSFEDAWEPSRRPGGLDTFESRILR